VSLFSGKCARSVTPFRSAAAPPFETRTVDSNKSTGAIRQTCEQDFISSLNYFSLGFSTGLDYDAEVFGANGAASHEPLSLRFLRQPMSELREVSDGPEGWVLLRGLPSQAPRRWGALCLFLAVAVVAHACGDPTAPRLALYPDITAVVVGEAAAALDGQGRFVIAPEIGASAEGVPLVSSDYAAELAAAFVKSYGPAFQSSWERDRGRAVDLASLLPSPRVFPIQTPFERVPDVGCHPAFVRLFGSFYLMTLDGQEPAVQMAVSAQTTEYSANGSGDLVEPSRTGADFFHEGISSDGTWVITPEQAVAVATRATGALVAEVPELTRRNVSFSPTVALWRIALDRDITVRRPDGIQGPTRTLYIGVLPQGRYYLPTVQQPTEVTSTCPRVDENLVNHGSATFAVRVLEGQPIDFERVSLIR